MSEQPKILLIEDDRVYRVRLAKALTHRGYQVVEVDCIEQLHTALVQNIFHYGIIDLKIGKESGLVALREVKKQQPDCRTVLLTGFGTIATAVEAMKEGATHYLTKPTDLQTLLQVLVEGSEIIPSSEQEELPLPTLAQLEWEHIQGVLKSCDGNITHAAKLLGMHRRSLQRRLAKDPSALQ